MPDQVYDKQMLEDGVIVFRLKSTAHDHVDAWFQDVGRVLTEAHDKHTMARLMYDTRDIALITPYLVQKAEDLNKFPQPDDWRIATLVKNAFMANMVNYVRMVSLQPTMRERSRVFSDEAEALAWLRA